MITAQLKMLTFSLGAVAIMSCGAEPTDPVDTNVTLEVGPSSLTFDALDASAILTVTARDANGASVSGVQYAFSSSANGVAAVDAAGLVTATGNGTAVITVDVAAGSGISATAPGQVNVTVQQVAVAVQIVNANSAVFEGETLQLVVAATDANGHPVDAAVVDLTALTWTTTDASIITVDPTGLVTGVAMGPATVRVDAPAQPVIEGALLAGGVTADSVAVDVLVTFTALSAGAFHTCGLTEHERAYCWGSNGQGRLGSMTAADSAPRNRHVPTRGDREYESVVAGDSHTCAIDSNAAAFCWGLGDHGQLGGGTATGLSENVDPAPVMGGLSFGALALGWRQTCGITAAGALYCWGLGTSGGLASGDTVTSTMPMLGASGLTFTSIASGEHHACAIAADARVYCWGDNSLGQIGAATGEVCVDIFANQSACATSPTRVSDSLTFRSISAGRSHTCGATTSGDAYCWGDGTEGRLGNGVIDTLLVPTLIADSLEFEMVSAGIAHTCGVVLDGSAWCWGSNIVGQLGDGTLTDRSSPVRVGGGLQFESVTAGASHTCGVTTDRTAYCWGHNFQGQVGDGTNTRRLLPVRVLGQAVQ